MSNNARVQDLMLSLALPHLSGEDRLRALSMAMLASAVESLGPRLLRGAASSMADTLAMPGMIDAVFDQTLRAMAASGRPVSPEAMQMLKGMRAALAPLVDGAPAQGDTATPFPAGVQYGVPLRRPMPPHSPFGGRCAAPSVAGRCPDEGCEVEHGKWAILGTAGECWRVLDHRFEDGHVVQRYALRSVDGASAVLDPRSVRCYADTLPLSALALYRIAATARAAGDVSVPVALRLHFPPIGDDGWGQRLSPPIDHEGALGPHTSTSDPPEVAVEADPVFGCVIVARKRYAKVEEIPVKVAEGLAPGAPSAVVGDPFASAAAREIAVVVKGVPWGAEVKFRGDEISGLNPLTARSLPNGAGAYCLPDGEETGTRVFGFPYDPHIAQEFAVVSKGGRLLRFPLGMGTLHKGVISAPDPTEPRPYEGEWMEFSALPDHP